MERYYSNACPDLYTTFSQVSVIAEADEHKFLHLKCRKHLFWLNLCICQFIFRKMNVVPTVSPSISVITANNESHHVSVTENAPVVNRYDTKMRLNYIRISRAFMQHS